MTPLAFALLIDALCVAGLSAAVLMQRKAMRYARGLETEPSGVQQPRARLLGGIPNSALGSAYYSALRFAAWWLQIPWVHGLALAASALAAAVSVFLAYSLLFVTRMPCPICWSGHVLNWGLVVLLLGYPVLVHSGGS